MEAIFQLCEIAPCHSLSCLPHSPKCRIRAVPKAGATACGHLGSRMASGWRGTRATRSGKYHSVSRGLIRMMMPGRPVCDASRAAAALRAVGLAEGAMLSSRSRITASASEAYALVTLRSELDFGHFRSCAGPEVRL